LLLCDFVRALIGTYTALQVASIDALSRETLHTVFSNVLSSVPAIAALNLRRALGPLRPVVLPVATPLEVMSR
jgi:aarF domain-containing kinase